MTNHDPLIGRTLRNEYVIEAILGEGGMGAVYRAHQKSLNRVVAIKVMHPHIAKEKGFIDRFNREAQTSARLEHPNIVPIYDYGQEDGYVYLVMRLLTGGSLASYLEQEKTLPTLPEVADMIKLVASALDYAHSKGVIHRDIKPSNIMFDENGTPYLVDFGIAKLMTANTGLTGTGMAIGTPNFMPPEQWRGDAISPKADQYALAVITYHMLTGKMPFEGDTPFVLMHKHLHEYPTPLSQYRADLPPAVMNILLRALAKDAQDRFASCSAFASALDTLAGDDADGTQTNMFISPTPVTPSGRKRTPMPTNTPHGAPVGQNRRRVLVGVSGIIALLLMAGLLALLAGRGDDTSELSATNTISSVVILPSDTPSSTASPTVTQTHTPDILTAIAYIDATNTAQVPLNMTTTAQAQLATPTTDFTATIDAIMANRTATQQITESIATNIAQKATDQVLTATQNALNNIAQQANANQLATQAALDRISTDISREQTAVATLSTPTSTVTPTATLPNILLGQVNVQGGVNMRREPNPTAQIVALIPEGTILILTQRDANNQWLYGSFSTETGVIAGWVFGQYLTITQSALDTPFISGVIQGTTRVNMRRGAGENFSIITTLMPNTTVQIIGQNSSGDWLNIQLDDGTQGWVLATSVQIQLP